MKFVKNAVLVLVVVGGIFGWKFYKKSSAGDEARQAIAGWVQALEEYPANEEYFETILDDAHEKAFDKTYRMGSRRRGSRFDTDEYVEIVFTTMASRAKSDGKSEIEAAVVRAHEAYDAAPESDG